MDIVLQGNLTDATKSVVQNCLQTSFLDKLILSCWEGEGVEWVDKRVEIIQSPDVKNPGIGNRNRQIVSSLAGVRAATAPLVAKLRTDQIITVESLEMMWQFFSSRLTPKLRFADGSGPQAQMCVAGIFWPFPFHPRDHLFFAGREDLIKLFDVPHCPFPPTPGEEYHKYSRAECYLGTHYAKHFFPEAGKFLENPEYYLSDNGEGRTEAMDLSNKYRDQIFTVFPRIDFAWPKHGMQQYHYWHTQCIEYWDDNKPS